MKNGPLKGGGVMQISARDHVEVHSERKKGSSLFFIIIMIFI